MGNQIGGADLGFGINSFISLFIRLFNTAVRLRQQCLYNGYVVNKSYKVQISATSEQCSSWYVTNGMSQMHCANVGDEPISGMSQMHCSKVGDEPMSKNAGL